MSTFLIQNGDVKELPDCDHKEDGFTCMGCNERYCKYCVDRKQDDSGEYYCGQCAEKFLTTCDRCEVLTSEANTGLCENCSDEMR
jgi:hypothetical protein